MAGAGEVTAVEVRIECAGGIGLAVRRWEPQGPGDVPVLAVHGLASNARMWDGVAAGLSALGHPVAAVDLRGHGRSDKPDGGYDFATVAADLDAVIGALGWQGQQRPLVAGQSWGGAVVLELAVRHPDAARAIACIDGGTLELSREFPSWDAAKEALSPPKLIGLPAADFERGVRAMHPDWPETGIQGALANVEVRPDGTIAPWLTLDRHLQILRHLWEHRPSQRYGRVPVPVLVVPALPRPGAGRGPALPARRRAVDEAEASLPTARVEWMEGDHDLHAQHPEAVARLLHAACQGGFW